MITAIVLTLNEGEHVERCLHSVLPFVQRIVVVDSNSTDGTRGLAREMGAEVLLNPWTNYATQFNWALDNAHIATPFVFRLDADEIVTPELAKILRTFPEAAAPGVAGWTVNRQIHFLGRSMRHGAIYPLRMLRIFRFGKGRCEQRWMDEHIVVDGEVEHLEADIIDENLKSLSWWTDKHNGYATREIIDILLNQKNGERDDSVVMNRQASAKRWMKESVYGRLPLGVRPAMYFLYRYLFRLGILDGWQGFVFHVLQGFWYRFLVDAKLMETRHLMRKQGLSPAEAIDRLYGIKI